MNVTLNKDPLEMKALFDNAPLVMVLLDSERRVHRLNKAAVAFSRRPEEATTGLRLGNALRCANVSDHPQGCGYGSDCGSCVVRNTVDATFRTGRVQRSVEASFPYDADPGGVMRWALVSTSRLKMTKGERVLVCMEDITTRKELESQLQHAFKMKSIGTFAGGIAHDFNNILSVVIGNAELALTDVSEGNPAHVSLQEIKSAGLKAKSIVQQLLDFSRRTPFELSPIAVVPVIKDAVDFLRSTMPPDIHVRLTIHDDDGIIQGNSSQIKQMILNLGANAAQVMRPAGGVLSIDVDRIALDPCTVGRFPEMTPGRYVRVTVSDTGPGIDPLIVDRIFDPYFTTEDLGKCAGLGLSVVHGIVKNLSGAISVENPPKKGTQFTIVFPSLLQPDATSVTIEDAPGGSERILFVDDETAIASMSLEMLGRLGYQVDIHTNPNHALDLFRAQPHAFDLVITDMTMPEMTGLGLSEKLQEIRPDIPIIICTGHSPMVNDEKVRLAGIAALAMKPIEIRDIANTIRKVLDPA
jgi:signal transduction histidine kinase